MRSHSTKSLVLAALLALPLTATAQERGRTDGPEGSEIGKGGYLSPGGGNFSLNLNFGASIGGYPNSRLAPAGADFGPPLFLGLVGTYWASDWFLLELEGDYLLNNQTVNVLAGPRFRTAAFPIGLSAGLKAGIIYNTFNGVRFGLSPQVGADMLLADHLLLGLHYALDIPIGSPGVDHRIFMAVGYRF